MVRTIDQITNRPAPDRGQNRARSLEFLSKRRVCRFDSSIRFSRAGYPASPLHMVSGFSMIAHPPVVNHRLRGFIEPSGGFPETEDFCGRKRFSAIDARISKRLENLLRHKDCDFLLGKSEQPTRLLGIESGGKMAKRKQFPPILGSSARLGSSPVGSEIFELQKCLALQTSLGKKCNPWRLTRLGFSTDSGLTAANGLRSGSDLLTQPHVRSFTR